MEKAIDDKQSLGLKKTETLEILAEKAKTVSNTSYNWRTDRRKYQAHLKDLIQYVDLSSNSKSPLVENSTIVYTSKPSRRRNVGAHPINNLVIFDIDQHPLISMKEQLRVLGQIFSLPLKDTLTVSTPSGGKHIYVIWPENVELPKNYGLEALKKLGIDLKGDIRSSGVNGHVLMAGSILDGKEYYLEIDHPPLTLSEKTAQIIINSFNSIENNRTLPLFDEISHIPLLKERDLLKEMPQRTFKFIEKMLKEKQSLKTWHSKRAFVYALISCCYHPTVIIETWRRLDLHRDTYRKDNYIPIGELRKELKRLKRSSHGGVCCPFALEKNTNPLEATYDSLSLEQRKNAHLKRLQTKTAWRTPTVLDLPKAIKALRPKRQKPSKYFPLALHIMEDMLQPWLNFGVHNIILNSNFLATYYGVSLLEVKKAKQLLLNRGIISVKVRQKPGVSTVFIVNDEFKQESLGKLLFALQKKHEDEQKAIFFDAREAIFYDALSGEVMLQTKPFADFIKPLDPNELPPKSVAGPVYFYLEREN